MVASADRGQAAALTAVVEDLAGELSLRPLLERILLRSTELLGCDAGSICLVDEAAGVYRKEADIGIALPVGHGVPAQRGRDRRDRGAARSGDLRRLREGPRRPRPARGSRGAQGRDRRPDLVARRDRRVLRRVLPGREPRRSSPADAELLEVFAKHAAIAITNARLHEAAEANARAEAVAAERNRMAREVHDAVAQGLVSILLQLRSADGAIAVGQVEEASDALGRGAHGGRGGVRGDAAQRARPRALAARGTVRSRRR